MSVMVHQAKTDSSERHVIADATVRTLKDVDSVRATKGSDHTLKLDSPSSFPKSSVPGQRSGQRRMSLKVLVSPGLKV